MQTNHTLCTCSKCGAVNKVQTIKIEAAQAVCGKCQTNLNFHKYVSETTDQGLMKLIEKSDLPVVVDFWAPWCGPCRSFAPTFESASEIAKGKVVFVKLNTENYPQISGHFGIRGIPTLMVFKNGKEVTRESGAFPLDYFNKWLAQYY